MWTFVWVKQEYFASFAQHNDVSAAAITDGSI
jgi:hypothetical protein